MSSSINPNMNTILEEISKKREERNLLENEYERLLSEVQNAFNNRNDDALNNTFGPLIDNCKKGQKIDFEIQELSNKLIDEMKKSKQ